MNQNETGQILPNQSHYAQRKFAGLPVASATFEEAIRQIISMKFGETPGRDIHLINSYSIALADQERKFKECLANATLNYPDGKPLSLLTRFSPVRLHHVRGPSLFEAVLERGVSGEKRHFLLGSSEGTLAKLESAIEAKFPGARIVGLLSPPFRELSEAEFRKQDAYIKSVRPDIVWVGLGTPKQDFEAQRLAQHGFNAVAVGAAFDFTAGTKPSAPTFMTALGAEWLFRLATEPRRLWRRYLHGNVRFAKVVIRNWERG